MPRAAWRAGAVPGAIANGICAGRDGRPWFDMRAENPAIETNGVDLRNNARYIGALAHLRRVRMAGMLPH